MGPEKRFENKVRLYLKSLDRQWNFKVFGNAFQQSGVPDIVGCVNGRFIALEIKSEVGKASPLQLYTIDQINKAGGYARVVSPKNWEGIKKDLEEMGVW